jgi:hypothetical protein
MWEVLSQFKPQSSISLDGQRTTHKIKYNSVWSVSRAGSDAESPVYNTRTNQHLK